MREVQPAHCGRGSGSAGRARQIRGARNRLYRAPGPDPRRPARLVGPLFVPDGVGGLGVATLEWDFSLEDKPHAVFNTRMQLRHGRRGIWTKAIIHRLTYLASIYDDIILFV